MYCPNQISVWRENNVGNMSLLVAVALFLNGVSWTAYGHLADNLYFIVSFTHYILIL